MNNASYVLSIFTILSAWRLWLFVTQRAALKFGRKLDIGSDWKLMLPTWYGLTVWPNNIARWVLIFLIFQQLGILAAILAIAIPAFATLVFPIPYAFLLPVFEKSLLKDVSLGQLDPQINIYARLKGLRNELGMPEATDEALSSEDERIKAFLRIYKSVKNRFPDLDERQILGLVIEEHILPNKNIKLRNSGMKGIDYIDGVFENRKLTIDDVILHAIRLEFPNKYPSKIDLEEIRRINRGLQPDTRGQLREKIQQMRKKYA